MAFVWDLDSGFTRKMHFDEMIAAAGSETVSATIDLTSQKAAAVSAINTLIDAVTTEYDAVPGFEDDMNQLKEDIEAAINSNITGAGATIAVSAAVAALRTSWLTVVETGQEGFDGREHPCTKCDDNGVHAKSIDTGNSADDNVKKICDNCAGYTKTVTPITPNKVFPNQDPYQEEVPA